MRICAGCEQPIIKCDCETDDLMIHFGMSQQELNQVIHKAKARKKKYDPGLQH